MKIVIDISKELWWHIDNCKPLSEEQYEELEFATRFGKRMAQVNRQDIIDALKKGYWDKDLHSAKDDPCVIDAMIDWAIRQVKSVEPKGETE